MDYCAKANIGWEQNWSLLKLESPINCPHLKWPSNSSFFAKWLLSNFLSQHTATRRQSLSKWECLNWHEYYKLHFQSVQLYTFLCCIKDYKKVFPLKIIHFQDVYRTWENLWNINPWSKILWFSKVNNEF